MKRSPTPTEYRGVLYRSKCEAMFARFIDTSMDCDGFCYEPATFIKGFNPDFVTWSVSPPQPDPTDLRLWTFLPVMSLHFIEYKPAKPSDVYVHRFGINASKWLDLARARETGHLVQNTFFSIFYGNPYNYRNGGEIGFELVNGSMVDFDAKFDWLEFHQADLLDYRFDLKNGGTRGGFNG